MVKYYVYDNATRRLRSGKFTFSFDVTEQFGGNWRGVLKLDDDEQIAALSAFAASIGVVEIDETEYNRLLKKKLNSSKPSPDITRLPTSALKEGAAGPVAVRYPSAPTTSKVTDTKPTVDEAVTIGTAPYVDPLEQRTNKRKSKKP